MEDRTMRNLFPRLFLGGILLGALALTFGPYGCTDPGTTGGKCAGKADCTCDADTDCGTGEICDSTLKKCFKDCTATGFAGCDDGNKCDETLKRCVCDQTACEKLAESGCHPTSNTCQTFCKDDAGCVNSNEKCIGEEGKKFCIDPAKTECDPAENTADGKNPKCTDAEKTACDAATRKCIKPAGCSADADCTEAGKTKCDTQSKKCVECLTDADCAGKTCDPATLVCTGPAACTDTPTCYTADPTSYCDANDTAKGCQKAAVDGCEVDYAGNNSAWSTDIGSKKGSIIWGATVKRTTDAENCKDSDGNAITNGMAEITFYYYNPGGNFATCYKCIKWGDGNKSYEFPTETVTTSGDKTSGTATFQLCRESSGKIEFVAWEGESDSTTNPSNALCADLPAL